MAFLLSYIPELFIYPNLTNNPEVFTFHTKRKVFVVESCPGGIMGHCHALTQVKNVDKPINGAEVYFTIDNDFLHSHPDDKKMYYIIGTNVYDYDTQKKISTTNWGAAHFHGIKVREVYEFRKKNNKR
jgi:hypothetical protein